MRAAASPAELSHPSEEPLKPQSVFYPGNRVKMNIVGMFVNLFLPWAAFVLVAGLTGFQSLYRSPATVWIVLAFLFVVWLCFSAVAVANRRHNPQPTWHMYLTIMVFVFGIAGLIVGLVTYEQYTKHYFRTQDLKSVEHLNIQNTSGADVMDAGAFNFMEGTHIAPEYSWHFKKKHLYCVAPLFVKVNPRDTEGASSIMGREIPLQSGSVDWFAVGKDCCSEGSGDFRCGPWMNGNAHSALRVLDKEDLKWYGLGAQQFSSLYNMKVTRPVFVEWSNDVMAQLEYKNRMAFRAVLLSYLFAFIVSSFFLSIAVAAFAWLGRRKNVYQEAANVGAYAA